MKTAERKLGQDSVWEAQWHSCHFYLISKNRAAELPELSFLSDVDSWDLNSIIPMSSLSSSSSSFLI